MELSIIIVSWNVSAFLQRCLLALKETVQTTSYEILIVDNASEDNTAQMVQSHFPELTYLQQDENLGFGKACNIALKHAQGEYVLFLNPDTEVQPQAIELLLKKIKEDNNIGFIGPKILNSDGSFQVACRRSLPGPKVALYKMLGLARLFPRHPHFAKYNLGHLPIDQESEVEAISGSCMLVRRNLLGQGFDERFFMYAEDLDLCLHILNQKKKGYYYPQAVVMHHYRQSSEQRALRSAVIFYWSAYLFYRKHYAQKTSVIVSFMIIMGLLLKAGFACLCLIFRKNKKLDGKSTENT